MALGLRAGHGHRRRWSARCTAGTRSFDGDAIITVGALIAAPLGFLIGIGCFDYWFRWASGAPTIPEDHSGHGAYCGATTSASTPTTR